MSAPEGDEEKGSPPASTTAGGGPSTTDEESKPSGGQISVETAFALGCCCCCTVSVVIVVSVVLAMWDVISGLKTDLQPEDFEYGKWATVSDVSECSRVARVIFKNGGKLGDAAVATLLCMGVAAPHLMGIGGGFIALHYDQKNDKVRALNALGMAPSTVGHIGTKDTQRGQRAYIVPGALRGYETLYKDLGGKLTWKQLFAPAINLANGGFPIKTHFAAILNSHRSEIDKTSQLQPMFKDVKKAGDKLVQKELARILAEISEGDATVFYTKKAGDLTGDATTMTATDLSDYKVNWTEAVVQDTYEDDQFFSAPFPSSGVLVTPGMDTPNVAFTDQYRPNKNDSRQASDKVQDLKKRMKHVLAVIPELGDGAGDPGFASLVKRIMDGIAGKKDAPAPKYPVVPDYGGVHLSIINEEGALSIVSGLNEPFGSKTAPVAGVIMNNYMSAFDMPSKGEESTPNELKESAQPRTSLNPIMAKRKSEKMIRLAAGAGGGLNGMWALAQVLTCISISQASSCVRQADRIAPEFAARDSVTDIQPTASGIFAKNPFVSWLAPSDNEHCDGSSDGGKVKVEKKIEAFGNRE